VGVMVGVGVGAAISGLPGALLFTILLKDNLLLTASL